MKITGMELFVMVYQECNFARTAETLYMSPQSVSKRIKMIEKELGAPLFKRTPQGLEPTEAGDKAYRVFQSILEEYKALQADLLGSASNKPVLKIGVELYNTNVVDLDSILKFSRMSKHDTKIEINYYSMNDCYSKVLDGSVDIAITNRPLTVKGNFAFYSLQRREAYCVFPVKAHPPQKEELSLEDFEGHTFLGIMEADSTNRAICNIFKRANVKVNRKAVSYDTNSLTVALKANMGFHVVPENFAKQLQENPDIAMWRFPSSEPIFNIGLVLLKENDSNPYVKEFVQCVMDKKIHVLNEDA